MKLIKMLGSGYGHRPAGSKVTQLKRAGDPPFEVEDAEADRLVNKLKVAAYVETPAPAEIKPPGAVATPPNGKTDAGKGNTSPPEKPEYSADMKATELKALLKAANLKYKVGMTNADIVAALDEFYGVSHELVNPDAEDPGEDLQEDLPEDPEVEDAEADENDDPVDNGEDPPDLSAEDPVL